MMKQLDLRHKNQQIQPLYVHNWKTFRERAQLHIFTEAVDLILTIISESMQMNNESDYGGNNKPVNDGIKWLGV